MMKRKRITRNKKGDLESAVREDGTFFVVIYFGVAKYQTIYYISNVKKNVKLFGFLKLICIIYM